MNETANKFLRRKVVIEVSLMVGFLLFFIGIISLIVSTRLALALSLSIGGFVLFAFSVGGYTKLIHDFKHHFIETALAGFVKHAKHVPHEGLSMHQIHSSGFTVDKETRRENFLSGVIEQTAFVSSDFQVNNTQPQKMFIFEMHHHFRTNVLCYKDPTNIKEADHYVPIHTGRIVKDFPLKVVAEEKYEADHVLTPYIANYMKRIVDLDSVHAASFAFYESRFSVCFHGGFDFAFKPFRSIPQTEIKRFRDAISALAHIVEALRANPHAFKKN